MRFCYILLNVVVQWSRLIGLMVNRLILKLTRNIQAVPILTYVYTIGILRHKIKYFEDYNYTGYYDII